MFMIISIIIVGIFGSGPVRLGVSWNIKVNSKVSHKYLILLNTTAPPPPQPPLIVSNKLKIRVFFVFNIRSRKTINKMLKSLKNYTRDVIKMWNYRSPS